MAENKSNESVFALTGQGVRANVSSSAGLKKDGEGNIRGNTYIAEIGEALSNEGRDHPHDRYLYAPTPVCQETAQALIDNAPNLVNLGPRRVLKEAPELYTSRIAEWVPLVGKLGGQDFMSGKTLAELSLAGSKDFILSEGENIFCFIETMAKTDEEDTSTICVLPSPLSEALMIYLFFCKNNLKALERIRMLDYLDSYLVFFKNGEYDFTLYRSYWRKVRRLRQEKVLDRS